MHLLQCNIRHLMGRYNSKMTICQSIQTFQNNNKLDLNNHWITRTLCRIHHWKLWPHVSHWLLFVCVVLSVLGVLTVCVVCGMYYKLMTRVQYTIHTGEHVPPYVVKGRGSGHRIEVVSARKSFPRLVHQLWKTADVPERYTQAVASCKRLNPTWEYRLWTDDDIDKFIAFEYPFFYEAFQSYPYQIQRVDAARYFILLHHGGVTIDIDLECKTPLDEILANKTGYDLVVPETDPFGVTVEFMAAKPGRPFLLHVVMDLYSNMANYILPYVTIIFTTGPMYLTNRMVDYPKHDEIYVIPQEIYRTKYFRNLHGGSWHRWDSALIKSVYKLTSPFVFVPILLSIVCLLFAKCRRK